MESCSMQSFVYGFFHSNSLFVRFIMLLCEAIINSFPLLCSIPFYEYSVEIVLVAQSCPTLCNPMDCSPARLLRPWDSPGKNTGVDCHFLFQGIFLTQGSNPGLPHCRQTLYLLRHQGSLVGRSQVPLKSMIRQIRLVILIPQAVMEWSQRPGKAD